MPHRSVLAVLLSLLLSACALGRARPPVPPWQAGYDIAVLVLDARGSIGTGAVLDRRGYILTNDHAITTDGQVSPAMPPKVCLLEKGVRACKAAEVIARDPLRDLAIIRVDMAFRRSIAFGDDTKLVTGEPLVALGHIWNLLPLSAVHGHFLNRIEAPFNSSPGAPEVLPLLAADLNAVHGMSGGPVFNGRGECIGLTRALLMGSGKTTIGILIPANTLRVFVKQHVLP